MCLGFKSHLGHVGMETAKIDRHNFLLNCFIALELVWIYLLNCGIWIDYFFVSCRNWIVFLQ